MLRLCVQDPIHCSLLCNVDCGTTYHIEIIIMMIIIICFAFCLQCSVLFVLEDKIRSFLMMIQVSALVFSWYFVFNSG